jgi:tRNA(Arg) A34 adenosine deaminase TadA
MDLDHEHHMERAIAQGRRNPAAAFGCVIVDSASGEAVAEGVNDASANPGFHGEIVTINHCAAGRPDVDWGRLVLYSTAEPCPMCMSAILWAGFAGVVYGTSIPTLVRLGWDQIDLRAEEVLSRTPFRDCFLLGGVLEAECDRLFDVAGKLYGGAPHA